MKALALVLCLLLGACAPGSIINALSPNATIANPVTRDMLYDVENGAIVVFAGLNVYKKSCVAGAIPPSCRDVIRKVQVYTRQIPPYLSELRKFVRSNDQINAAAVYNIVTGLIANAKAVQGAN
jgi:hypothetical protein